MAYTRTNWKARQGTNLNKFTKSQETDTTVVLTNAPDAVSEAGTPFSAENMNHIEEGIAGIDQTKAPINSPTFTGVPTVPNKTSMPVNDGTLIATEAQFFGGSSFILRGSLPSGDFTKNSYWAQLPNGIYHAEGLSLYIPGYINHTGTRACSHYEKGYKYRQEK